MSQHLTLLFVFTLICLIASNVRADARSEIGKNFDLSFVASSRELSKRAAECLLNVNIQDCNDENFAKVLITRKAMRFVAIYQSNCVYEIKYDWVIKQYNSDTEFAKASDTTENVFVVQPYTFKTPGYYDVIVTANAFRDSRKTSKTAKCSFSVNRDKAIPVIQGGSERIVESGRSFTVDGSKSIDMTVPPNTPGHLSFRWACNVAGNAQEFCNKTKDYDGAKLEVPAKYVKKDDKFLFTLEVKYENFGFSWSSTDQYVTVMENVVELEIICEKNCPPAAPKTDRGRETFLRSNCLKGCDDINEKSFEWKVENVADFNYDNTQFGRNTDKFIIKPDVLNPDVEYQIRVSLTSGKTGSALKKIQVYSPPVIESCQVKPPEGVAIETKFKVECEYTGDDIFFEIYTMNQDKKVRIAKSFEISNLELLLPANAKAYIRIADSEGSFTDHQLTVNVKEAAVSGKNELKRFTSLSDQIKKLTQEKNIEAAIQVTNGLMEEMDKRPANAANQKIRRNILEDFKQIHITTSSDARQIASMVTRVVHSNEQESDPYQGELATSLCAEAAKVDLAYLEKENYPTSFTSDTKESATTFMKCGEVDTKANFKILKPVQMPLGMTTPFPVLTLPVISEDYPDYVSDESVAEKRDKYEKASENYVEICQTNLKMMALTMVEGEDTMIAHTGLASAQVTRLTGTKLVKHAIEAKGATIRPSGDFTSVEIPVDVMVCSWSKDPFWWNLRKQVVVTNVILLKMRENKKEIADFTKPNRISFDISEPYKYVKTYKVYNESVARITVRAGEAFFVEFYNLTETFRAMITELWKPNFDEVKKNGRIISKASNSLYQEHNHNRNTWYYVTLVPTEAVDDFDYTISAYSMSCYSWNRVKKEWQFACKGFFNSSEKKLNCHCNHLSILAGMVRNNLIKIEELIDLDFAMSLTYSYIIFTTVCVIFGLFCVAFLLNVFKKGIAGRNIYLPPDISSSFLYAYLLKIRTGRRPLSGTTSNICVKIVGEKHKSKSHVLNYPDPQTRIFQWGGEDWFVIPTRHYLGKISEISLWTDYSGRNPSWFCSDVTVYDLQTNQKLSKQKWFFKLNAWFSIPPDGEIFITAKDSQEENKDRVVISALTRICPRWSHQDGLTIFEKLTLFLSTILTIFVIAFLMYGLPSLKLNDGFVVVNQYWLYPHVFLIALASSITTFIVHIPLTWLFKKRTQNGFCCCFLIINISLSMSVLVIFGFWVPAVTGWLWLTSVFIAMILYFFVFENTYEKVASILFKREDDVDWFTKLNSLVPAIEAQRTQLFGMFGEDLLRPYFTHLYEPIDDEDIKERKLREEARFKLTSLLEDMIMVSCYLTLLYLAIFANKNPWSVKSHQEILFLINGVPNRTMNTRSVRSVEDFYNYMNTSLIPNVQANQWYWKFVIQDPGNMRDFENKYLGVPRLRQQRAKTRSCKLPKIIQFSGKTCRSEFWTANRNKSHFGPTNHSRLELVWNYTKSKTAGMSMVVGKFGIYTGGGFVAPLGRTRYNSWVNLDYLKRHQWLDAATSVIFVEFLTYNVNVNLFNAVRITVEKSVTGYFRVVADIKTAQLLFVKDEDEIAVVSIFWSFFLIVFIFTVKILMRLWKGKLLFLKDFWSLVDLSIVGMSYGCFGLYVHRVKLVGKFLEKLDKSKKNQFVNYFHVFHEDLIFILVAAFLVFLSTVRLWKLCRFATVFKTMERSVLLALRPVVVIMLGQMIFFTAFTFTAYMLFGDSADYFKDVRGSLVTVFLLSMNFYRYFDLDLLKNSRTLTWGLFYSSFMAVSILFTTVYIVNIMICYHQAKVMDSAEDDFSAFKNFLVNELVYYKTVAQLLVARLKGGTEKKKYRKYVIPKPLENRYANCVSINVNKLKIMLGVAVYNLKQHSLNDNQKLKLMHWITVKTLIDSTEREIFFWKKIEENVVKMVRDEKIQKMAEVVQKICSGDIKRRNQAQRENHRILEKQQKLLDFIQQMLAAILRVIQNIEIK